MQTEKLPILLVDDDDRMFFEAALDWTFSYSRSRTVRARICVRDLFTEKK